jgi:hypothetical protein
LNYQRFYSLSRFLCLCTQISFEVGLVLDDAFILQSWLNFIDSSLVHSKQSAKYPTITKLTKLVKLYLTVHTQNTRGDEHI